MSELTLKDIRKAAGLTRKEAAEKLGLTVRALANYERGERLPNAYTILEMAYTYDEAAETVLYAAVNTHRRGQGDSRQER